MTVSGLAAVIPLTAAHAAAMTVADISTTDSASNAAGSKPTFTVHGTNIASDASLQLTPSFQAADPNAVPLTTITAPATTVTNDGTTWTWTGTATLAHAAAGSYAVSLVDGQTSAACTCTFTIASAGPPSPGPVVYPGTLAQGSSGTLRIPDDGAAAGAVVSSSKDSGVSVTGPARFGTSAECGTGQCILVPVTVDPAADPTTGKRDVIVTNPPQSSSDTANVGTCGACLSISAAPTLDSFDPKTLAQGAATTLTINGSNFADKARVSLGTGVTATDKPTVTASSITIPVTVAPDAPTAVTVTVTNPDFGTAHKDLTIDADPTITKSSPQYVATTLTGTLTLTGTNYHSSAAVTFPKDSGVTTSGTPTVSDDGTTLIVPIKVQRTTPGTFDVTVTNADDQGTAICAGCLGVAVAPADVTNLTATRDGTTTSVVWSAVPDSDNGGAPIAGYTVSVVQPANSGVQPQTVTTTSASYTGLSGTLNYTFKVVAVNAANLNSLGVIASTGGQVGGTALDLIGHPDALVAGQRLTLSGSLANSDGDPIPGATILITARNSAGQTATVGTTTTASDGNWSLTTAPKHNATYTASFAGDDQDATATSGRLRVTVAPRVSIATVRSSRSTPRVTVFGSVSPSKIGQTVHLIAVNLAGARKDLSTALKGNSSYRFTVRLGKGLWVLTVSISSTRDNTAGHSKGLRVKRT